MPRRREPGRFNCKDLWRAFRREPEGPTREPRRIVADSHRSVAARLRLLSCVLLLPLGLVLAILALTQTPAVRQRALLWAESRLQQKLQREVKVRGVAIRPWLGRIDLTGVQVARGPRLVEGLLFSAESIEARWSWTALLRRQLVFRDVRLSRPRLAAADGTGLGLLVQDGISLLLRRQLADGGGFGLRVLRASVHDGEAAWSASDGARFGVEGLEGEFVWSAGSEGAGPATAHVQAARLTITRGNRTRRLDRVSLRATGTAEAVSVSEAEFYAGRCPGQGARAHRRPDAGPTTGSGNGRAGPARRRPVTSRADRRIEGTLVVDGRLQGPWDQAAFRGTGKLQLGREPRQGAMLPFSIRWGEGRVEVEGRGGSSEGEGSFQGLLSLTPATGAYQVRAGLSHTNLAARAGLPLGLGWSPADLPLPAGVRGGSRPTWTCRGGGPIWPRCAGRRSFPSKAWRWRARHRRGISRRGSQRPPRVWMSKRSPCGPRGARSRDTGPWTFPRGSWSFRCGRLSGTWGRSRRDSACASSTGRRSFWDTPPARGRSRAWRGSSPGAGHGLRARASTSFRGTSRSPAAGSGRRAWSCARERAGQRCGGVCRPWERRRSAARISGGRLDLDVQGELDSARTDLIGLVPEMLALLGEVCKAELQTSS